MKTMQIIISILALALSGCSSYGDYYGSVDAANARQVEAQRAQSDADAARYQALMRIAESGDSTAKVAAVMALALSQNQGAQARMVVPAQPQNEALQWASILVPGVTQGLSIVYNTKLGMKQSDNSTALGMNTNQTFGAMAGEIAKPPVVVTQPDPVIVQQPAPVIVDPVVVRPAAPVVVDPVIVDPVIVSPVVVQPTQE